MGLRIVSAGDQAGLAVADTLAFSTALADFGVNAEAGGTAMSRFIGRVNTAVATGNADLKLFADVAGQSVADFKQAFEQDAAGALLSFFKGLNKVQTEGGNLAVTLNDLEITDQRLRDSVGRLAGGYDKLEGSLMSRPNRNVPFSGPVEVSPLVLLFVGL